MAQCLFHILGIFWKPLKNHIILVKSNSWQQSKSTYEVAICVFTSSREATWMDLLISKTKLYLQYIWGLETDLSHLDCAQWQRYCSHYKEWREKHTLPSFSLSIKKSPLLGSTEHFTINYQANILTFRQHKYLILFSVYITVPCSRLCCNPFQKRFLLIFEKKRQEHWSCSTTTFSQKQPSSCSSFLYQ